MTLFNHRFLGTNAAGDQFIFGWWDVSIETVVASQNARAVAWVQDAWAGSLGTNGIASLTVAATTVDTVITGEIDESTGKQVRRADSVVTLAGTATGAALPADVATVVSLRSALANRSGRGRFYLPQLAASQLTTDGRLLPAAQTSIVDALEFAWTNFNPNGQPVVHSRLLGGGNSPIVTFDVGDLFDTQRRRENKILEARASRTMP